ncbi:MAG: macro domain-containing protein, partial [Bacteroidota bacterium]
HTVGPVWNNGKGEVDQLLVSCYRKSLQLALEYKIKTIAFPNISTGIYRFPKARAAEIAINTVQEFLVENDSVQKVLFVCFDQENYQLYQEILASKDA